MLLTLNLPTYSQRHHSPFPTKTGAEKSRQLLTSFQWFCCQWRFRKFFSFFPGSSFFVLWKSFPRVFWVKYFRFGRWHSNFSRSWCVFFKERICWFCVVASLCFLRSERWKLEPKKRRAHSWCSFLRQHFWHDIWMCLPDASKLEISRSWKRVKQSLDR